MLSLALKQCTVYTTGYRKEIPEWLLLLKSLQIKARYIIYEKVKANRGEVIDGKVTSK